MAKSIQSERGIMSLGNQVIQFNEVYSVPVSPKPKLPSPEEAFRVLTLVTEETQETREALVEGDLVHIAKELGDILYVTAQQMAVLGLPVDAILQEIHASNMSKLDDDGLPIFREDGKVLKGPSFFRAEPGITQVLTLALLDDRSELEVTNG